MHIIQAPLFDFDAFIAKKGNDRLAMVLEALPAEGLIVHIREGTLDGAKRLFGTGDVVSSHRGSIEAGSFTG